jgi:hypothetical protein
MAPIPIEPDCVWNYSFCEWIGLGVEIDEDWYNVGNIKYDALDNLRGDFPQKCNILILINCCSFGICLEILRTKFL